MKFSLLCLRINTKVVKNSIKTKISKLYFSKNLKYLRKTRGYNQREFSKLLDLAQSTYASYESGKSQPNLENLYLISDLLEVDIGKLIVLDLENENIDNISEGFEKIETFEKTTNDKRRIDELEAKVKVMEDFIRDSIEVMMETVKRSKDEDEKKMREK